MIINAARLLRDSDTVFVGVGQPNLACNLAKRTHAPNLVMIYEAGVIGAEPARLPLSIGDPTLVSGALSVVSMYDIFTNYLQRGNVDVGFMGGAQIDKYGNINATVIGVLAQRLVRALCQSCRERYQPDAKELERLAIEYCGETPLDAGKLLEEWRAQGKLALYRARGCKECDRTGYKGRMAVYELLIADPAVKRLIQSRAPVSEVAAAGMSNGMRTLKQDGIDKVLQGLTDIAQVRAL